MTFAIPQYSYVKKEFAQNLIDEVDAADNVGIVQMCSHHDEGWNVLKSWPADCKKAKIIVACNKYGAFPDRQPGRYDYQIHGMDIFTGAVPYLEAKDTISGSSVATAIASGLASLVLSCHRLQLEGKMKDLVRKRLVDEAFHKMSIETKVDNQRYLRLANFSSFAKDENGKSLFNWFDG
jgi:hypothetical protein